MFFQLVKKSPKNAPIYIFKNPHVSEPAQLKTMQVVKVHLVLNHVYIYLYLSH